MQRMILLSMLSVLILNITVFTYQANAQNTSEFQEFVKQQQQGTQQTAAEFGQFKEDLTAEFTAYKRLYQQEFAAYQQTINKHWGEFKSGDRDTWVSYDKKSVRKTVDFSRGEIEIEILVDDEGTDDKRIEAEAKKRFKKILATLLKTTEKTAFKQDVVAQNIEKKLPAISKNVKSGVPSDKRVMASLIPTLNKPTDKAVQEITKTLFEKAKTDTRPAKIEGKKIVRLKVNTPANLPNKALRFAESVNKSAKKERLPVALVFAVMEMESAFNPMAKSHIPAYGLMQIVPRSAGKDATKYLFGQAQLLAPSYLYNSDNNITIGSAYLHILYYRYLKAIKNPTSRMYCTIASYNTGAGNVARTFTGHTNIGKAAKIINKMTPEEVYEKLIHDLPYEETQHYLKKVSARMQRYQQEG